VVVAYGDLRPGVVYASGDGATISVHVDDPLPGHVTLALTDHDGRSVVVLPQPQFDGAIAAYMDRE